jgi:hypothetical protein
MCGGAPPALRRPPTTPEPGAPTPGTGKSKEKTMAVFVLHSILREGREAQYDRVHRRIPEDLLAALQDHGIEDWRIGAAGGTSSMWSIALTWTR